MSTYRLEIAYDGRPFSGWAAQPGLRTIQGEIEAALERILGDPVTTDGRRTDRRGCPRVGPGGELRLRRAAAGRLRSAASTPSPRARSRCKSASEAAAGFDARRDARSRTYCYRLSPRRVADPFERGRALYWPYPLDRGLLDACAAAAVGRHDFTAFTPTQTEHVRFKREVLRCEWLEATGVGGNEVLEMWVEADAFMRSMVRVLAGTMLEVGAGRRTMADFEALLEGAERKQAGETAPAHGLYLARASY